MAAYTPVGSERFLYHQADTIPVDVQVQFGGGCLGAVVTTLRSTPADRGIRVCQTAEWTCEEHAAVDQKWGWGHSSGTAQSVTGYTAHYGATHFAVGAGGTTIAITATEGAVCVQPSTACQGPAMSNPCARPTVQDFDTPASISING